MKYFVIVEGFFELYYWKDPPEFILICITGILILMRVFLQMYMGFLETKYVLMIVDDLFD